MLKKFGKYLLPAGIMALVAAFFLIGAANLETPKTPGKNEPPAPPAEPKDAVVLYTNDVHCGIDGYAALAALLAEWSPEEYMDFLIKNGWEICFEKTAEASFPLTYLECKAKPE